MLLLQESTLVKIEKRGKARTETLQKSDDV
jgi:hypothetical protein